MTVYIWTARPLNFGNRCFIISPLNADFNPICHLLALLGGATIVVFSRLRVKGKVKGKGHPIAGHEGPEGE